MAVKSGGAAPWLALVAMGLSVIVLAQDFSAVNVALPDIERELDSDIGTVQWVINAYALVFAMLIVTGGRLADQFGRRRVFFIGTTIFVLFSTLAGIAPNAGLLIAARALMGIGAALMWPAILGMTYAILPKEKAGLAGGLIIGAAGVGQAMGLILGGALTELLNWRWIALINLPIGAFAMLVTWREVHLSEAASAKERLDYAGIVTLSLALVSLLFALDQVTAWGWGDARILGCLALFVVMLAAFIVIERRTGPNALVPRDVMRSRQFTAACLAIALVAPAFFTALLYLPQFMEKLLLYTPLKAGLGMLPMMICFAGVSFIGGQLYDRLGAKVMVASGAFCLGLGPLLLSFLEADSPYRALVPGMAVLGLGLGLFFSAATTAGVQAVDDSRTSLAGGIIYMFQIAGGSVGLGLTTMVVTSSSLSRLRDDLAASGANVTPGQSEVIHSILAGTQSAREALARFSPDVAARIGGIVSDAFAKGIDSGFRLAAALSFVAFAIALALIGDRKRNPAAGATAKKPAAGA